MENSCTKSICFISHNATRTGAPIVLYHFVQWLTLHTKHHIEVWFLEDGEMVKEFESICPTVVLPGTIVKGFFNRVIKKIFKKNLPLQKAVKGIEKFDLLFFNTIASQKIIPYLPAALKAKKIIWLHEQPLSINTWYKELAQKKNFEYFDKILSVSSQTKQYLREVIGIANENISIVYPFIDQGEPHKLEQKEGAFFFPPDSMIVGGCGLQDWRKGPDLFLQVAQNIKETHPEKMIHFVWVGAEAGMTKPLQYEVDKMDLKNKVSFTGAQTNMKEWFQRFDLFLLTSREDPFPLVVLEAAALGKPVICFDGIGDIVDIVRGEPKNVVAYGSTTGMADRIISYCNDKNAITITGTLLQNRVRNFEVDTAAPNLYKHL